MDFSLHIPPQIYVGSGSSQRLQDIIRREQSKHVAVFTDRSIRGLGLIKSVEAAIQKAGAEYTVIDDIPPEPAAEQVQNIARSYWHLQTDLIVAVGGGSVMDTAKLAAILPPDLTVQMLSENPQMGRKQVKTVFLPTTAGTGSEATPNAIVLFPEKELKVGIVHEDMIPEYVILDTDLVKNLPRKIAAATGVDALAHAIECYTSNKATPFSDMYALEAMRLIFPNIEKACDDPTAIEAKSNMQLAAFYAGVAITAAGTTAVHALSYPLGGKYGIAHGVSNAMLLGPVMEGNRESCQDRLAQIYDMLCPQQPADDRTKADYVIRRLCQIVEHLDIPKKLEAFGVPESDLETLVDNAFEVKRLLNNNRKVLTKADIRAIYLQLF